MSSEKLNKDFVGSLEKGLKVICAFDKDNNELTLTEVAKLTDITRATARRFLKTLEVLGYVNSDGRLFRLSPKILELGFAYLTSEPIVNIVQTFIEKISEQTGESSSVSVLDGNEIVYIARQSVNHIMSINLNIGSRLPALNTSMGRVLTAYLPEQLKQEMLEKITLTSKTSKTITDVNILSVELDKIKHQGYCIVDRELDNSLISVAVPLVNNQGRVVAAINIGASYDRMKNKNKLNKVIEILQKAASEIKPFLH